MKFCIPGKKLGRLKQKKKFLRVEARPKKRLCHNCSFQRSPGRNFKKAQTAIYKNVLTQLWLWYYDSYLLCSAPRKFNTEKGEISEFKPFNALTPK